MRFDSVSAALAAMVMFAASPVGAAEGSTTGLHVGVASCASAVCHGSLLPREGDNILRNEYVTWMEKDRHARAYSVLLSERSRSIAKNLGLGAAHESDLCLDCHSTNAPTSARGERSLVADGVSCESCHGPAAAWIDTHDDAGRTHAANVKSGLTDLADIGVRAAVCASCHVGDDRRFVTHRIMAAGHPRTGFELDTFTHLQPRHYRVDDDYRSRKGETPSVVAWSVGQGAVLADYLERIAGRASAGAGTWPEFALFDCFSCHHPIRSDAAGVAGLRAATSLGVPALLRASATMVALSTEAAGLTKDARIDPSLRDLDAALAARSDEAGRLAGEALHRVRLAQRGLASWKPSVSQLEKLLDSLAAPPALASYRGYSDAEQATMAVQAVIASLVESGAAKGEREKRLRAALDGLFAATRSESAFRPEEFAAAMRRVAR